MASKYMQICEFSLSAMALRNVVKLFKALSDETRLRILNVLSERECCVCEVMQALNISQSRASRNLGILEDAGLVRSRREGLWIVYSIDEQGATANSGRLIELVQSSLVDEKIILEDKERLKHASRSRPREMP